MKTKPKRKRYQRMVYQPPEIGRNRLMVLEKSFRKDYIAGEVLKSFYVQFKTKRAYLKVRTWAILLLSKTKRGHFGAALFDEGIYKLKFVRYI